MLWESPVALGEPSRVLKDGQEFARQSRRKKGTGRPEAPGSCLLGRRPHPHAPRGQGRVPRSASSGFCKRPAWDKCSLDICARKQGRDRGWRRGEEMQRPRSGRSPQSSGPERPGPGRHVHTMRGPGAAGSKVLQPVSAAGSVTGVGAQPAASPTTSPRTLASGSCLSFLCRGRQDSPLPRPEPGMRETRARVACPEVPTLPPLLPPAPEAEGRGRVDTDSLLGDVEGKCSPPGRPAGRCPKDGQVGASGLHLSEAWTRVWGLPPQHWCPGPKSDAGASRTHPDCVGPRDRLSLCLGGREFQPAWSQP